jgi:hypothetical protein
MQLFDRELAGTFLSERNRPSTPTEFDREFQSEGFFQTQFEIPVQAGRLLSLFRHLFRQERKSSWTLIIAEGPGIWPSWEDKNLYRMMRRSHALTTEMAYGDAHLFDCTETEDMVSFAYVFAIFRYDFRIVDSDREFHAFFSHDDFFFLQMAEKFGDVLRDVLKFTIEWPEKPNTL